MPDIFIATLGQRPEAITVALDLLSEQHHFESVCILHTQPELSKIAQAVTDLRAVFSRDYSHLAIRWHEITCADGSPLIDITNSTTAEDYFTSLYSTLRDYKRQGYTLHLMIAGGRKSMSAYATVAAGMLFSHRDRLWTVLSPAEMIEKPGVFHIPPGLRDQVQLVDLPILPQKYSQEEQALLDNPLALVAERRDIRRAFLDGLSPELRRLAELMTSQPAVTQQTYGQILRKSERTIENQIAKMYTILAEFVPDLPDGVHRRTVLNEVLQGRY
jgi:CRISPR-associated protein Csx14